MDTQIIISREDNTDFLSLGYIQTDTSLVSALGGALANFAQEIGLAGETGIEQSKNNAINFSKFQNGILASKMVAVKTHTPIILIAIREFEGPDKDFDFIVDYATRLANEIVIKFEKDYTKIGLVPRIDDAFDVIALVANQVYKKHPDKVKRYTKDMKNKITTLLEDLWENQNLFEQWSQEYANKKIAYLSQGEVQLDLARYFYIQGIKADAFFPLEFASEINPIVELSKLIDHFLMKKANAARKEVIAEITKIINQLNESSKALSNRELEDIIEVELINESFLFEKVLVTKIDQLEKTVNNLLIETSQDLYRKLFRKFPLKFISMSKEVVFDKNELDSLIKEVLATTLKNELADKKWISEKLTFVLRDVSAKYSANEIMKKQREIVDKTFDSFINSLKKDHPFILLVDPTLSTLEQYIRSEAEKTLSRFSTTLDEAVILYNSIGQIHSTITKEKATTTQDLMTLYFLQQVIQPYQFREVPDIVYALINECLSNIAYAKKGKPEDLVQSSIKQFEEKLNFTVAEGTKKEVLKRLGKLKGLMRHFEKYENLSFFYKSFRESLETTLGKILQKIFGPEKFPLPPIIMSKAIQKIAMDLQSIFVIKLIIEKIIQRPNGRELFAEDLSKILESHAKVKAIFPTPWELARVAYETSWIRSIDQKKQAKISENQLKALTVKIPDLKLEGDLISLLEKPYVLEELWLRFSTIIIDSRQKSLKDAVSVVEKQMKVTAGDVSGKQKFSSVAKALKNANKWLTNVLSGGGFMRKFLSGGKEIHQLPLDASKELYRYLKYHPNKITGVMNDQTIKSIINISPIEGDFQDLMQVFASIWIADSIYIDNIIDKVFWQGITKVNDSSQNFGHLERKIFQNLLNAYKGSGEKDKTENIRRTIIEEVVPAFYKIIRVALSDAFTIFKDDRIIQFSEKTNDWYISLGTVNAPRNALKEIFSSIPDVSLIKIHADSTDIRLILTGYYPLKRSKESHSLEEFIRKATFYEMNKKEIKALEFFSELNERYIGKTASDIFYSNIRSLAQMIITPIE